MMELLSKAKFYDFTNTLDLRIKQLNDTLEQQHHVNSSEVENLKTLTCILQDTVGLHQQQIELHTRAGKVGDNRAHMSQDDGSGHDSDDSREITRYHNHMEVCLQIIVPSTVAPVP